MGIIIQGNVTKMKIVKKSIRRFLKGKMDVIGAVTVGSVISVQTMLIIYRIGKVDVLPHELTSCSIIWGFFSIHFK